MIPTRPDRIAIAARARGAVVAPGRVGNQGPRVRPMPAARRMALAILVGALMWLQRGPAAAQTFSTAVTPGGANVILNQPAAAALLRWDTTIQFSPSPTQAISTQGCFTPTPVPAVFGVPSCPPPPGITNLGTVNVPLTGTLVASPSGGTFTGTSTALESLVIPQAVSLKAFQLGITAFAYNRSFTVPAIPIPAPPANAPFLTCRIGTSAYGIFSISRVEMYFTRGRNDITVRRGTQGLKAYADILFNGTGTLRARWLVAEPGSRATLPQLQVGSLVGAPDRIFRPDDWRILANVEKTITYGDRIVLESPDSPSLPAFVTGQHLVRLEILQERPSDAQVGVQLPVARYYVEGDRPGGQVVRAGPALRLTAPEDGAQLAMAPPTFSWLAIPGAAQYRVEIYEAEPRAGVLGGIGGDPTVELYRAGSGAMRTITLMDAVGAKVLTSVTQGAATSLGLHPGYLGRFRPGQVYLWKVVAVDGRGDAIATSPLRALSFRAP